MVVCEICGGNCDHGELVQGICPECREEEAKKKERAAVLDGLVESSFWQVELNLEVENGRNNNISRRI